MQQRRTPTPEQEHLGEHLYAHTIVRPAADPAAAFGIDVKDAEARWARDACPFEETRHNCFFFGQPNAGEVARRALGMLGMTNRTSRSSSSTASLLAALRGRRIHFVGDSVLRQLCQAVMCRLRSYLVHDGTNWWDPMKRRHPALDYKGMCPYAQARHCEMRYGCATFAARTSSSTSTGGQRKGGTSGGAQQEVGAHESTHERPLTICYVKEERLGWEGLIGALRKVTPAVPSGETRTIGARGKDAHRSIRGTAPHSPDVLVVSSGRHHSPIESLHAALWRQWGGTNDSSVATQRANFHSAFREALLARLEKYLIADDCGWEDVTDGFALWHGFDESAGAAGVDEVVGAVPVPLVMAMTGTLKTMRMGLTRSRMRSWISMRSGQVDRLHSSSQVSSLS
jgi:hypothetical protein